MFCFVKRRVSRTNEMLGGYTRIAAAVIAEFAKPSDAMLDAAFEAVRFDEAWAINSRRDFIKAVKAMVRTALDKHSKTD